MNQRVTRRRFLETTSASLAFAAGLPSTSQAKSRIPVVDTHLHCFAGTGDPRFPYHVRAPYRPEKAAPPEHLLKCMDGAGVDYAIVVHPEPYQDDHRYLEHCLEVGKGRLKGTCLFFADRPGSVEKMPALVKKCDVVTARIHAYAPGRLPPFRKPELRALWKQIADLGLIVQLHFEPRYAPGFQWFIEEFPDTKVIIDHLGRPLQGTPKEHAIVLRWARFGNTIIKLSSLPRQDRYPHRNIAPVIRQLVESYGADRMIYGGGFNAEATPQSYKQARERARSYIAFLPEEDQRKILGGNAAQLLEFGG